MVRAVFVTEIKAVPLYRPAWHEQIESRNPRRRDLDIFMPPCTFACHKDWYVPDEKTVEGGDGQGRQREESPFCCSLPGPL